MILTDKEILAAIESNQIIIKPFSNEFLGSNSYDVHLGEVLAEYDSSVLDAKKHNKITHFKIPEEGIILFPDRLYLGVIQEYTETLAHVPMLDGKSSTGRLGINIHATAGKGDIGFKGHWTLEISVILPVRVYQGMPVGQIYYLEAKGVPNISYDKKETSKYLNNSLLPMESMMFKNKF